MNLRYFILHVDKPLVAVTAARLLFRLIKYPMGEEEGVSERIIDALAQSKVVENFANAMKIPDLDLESSASVVRLLTLVAGKDEVNAFYVSRVLREELRCILVLCASRSDQVVSYLHSVLAVLLCRLASIDICLSCFLQIEEGTATLSTLIDAATKILEKVLSTSGDKAASIKSYDRHCFGLYITLLVYITNTEVNYFRRKLFCHKCRTRKFVRPSSMRWRSHFRINPILAFWYCFLAWCLVVTIVCSLAH